MKTHILKLSLAAFSLIVLSLISLPQGTMASGTSTEDLLVLAKKGNAMAQRTLGERYAMGLENTPKDMGQAIFWWQKAADSGDAMAQYDLGVAYYRGAGAPQDFVQAHMWFSLAESSGKDTASGRQGKKKAGNDRKVLETKMTPKQIEEARARAQEWLAKHR